MEKILLTNLFIQLKVHNEICDKIMDERFSYDKHDDKWNDNLFQEYTKSKIRLDLLSELIKNNEREN